MSIHATNSYITMSRRTWVGLLLLTAVMVVLLILEAPIEQAIDRLYYAPWAYGDETLTGMWAGRLPDEKAVTLTLVREEEGGIPTPTDARATVIGLADFAGESWQVTGYVNRSASEIELILRQGNSDNIGGFLKGVWSGGELLLDGEINGQTMTFHLTKSNNS